MKRAYIYEIVTGLLLVGVVEAYFWTQSRTFVFDNTTTRIALLTLYLVLAIGSQAALSWTLRIRLRDVVRANILVAAIVSAGLTVLGFFFHPAVLKDVPAEWTNAAIVFGKFFATVGMATLALRILVAGIAVRLRALDVRQR